MTRQHLHFACEGESLVGTLDEGSSTSGLLIVSGGNEIRSGAFSGQSALAAQLAAQGHPVFRFDRRGIGDSSGKNRGFRESRQDILAAIAKFRAVCPQMQRLVAFGNCDAASALLLMQGDLCDALIISNPWTFDDDDSDGLPPPAAIRRRYLDKLRNPAEIGRILRGDVNLSLLGRGLKSIVSKTPQASILAGELTRCLDACGKPSVILLAEKDRTAQAFAANCDPRQHEIRSCAGASHAYVEPHASAWLEAQVLEILRV